jgi:hypothetical protein
MAPVWLRAKVALDHVIEHTIFPEIAEKELVLKLKEGSIPCRAEKNRFTADANMLTRLIFASSGTRPPSFHGTWKKDLLDVVILLFIHHLPDQPTWGTFQHSALR